MRKITYTEKQVKEIVAMLNGLHVTGIEQARRLSYTAGILDSGVITEEEKKEE